MQPASTDRKPLVLISLGLLFAIVLIYSGVARCDFVYLDDTTHVFENATVRAGLTWEGVQRAFTEPHASLWVPLTTVSFMADVSLFGLSPAAMHVENMLWHAGAAILLFTVLRRLTGRQWPSALVAALFAVHPINVESVAWITERKNVLCAFFFMVSLWGWSHWAQARQGWGWWVALVAFAVSLLAKPMSVTLPCVLLLLDAWPLRRMGQIHWGRLIVEKIPFFALSVGSSYMAMRAVAATGTALDFENVSAAARFTNALCAYGAYLHDLVWPDSLAIFYRLSGDVQWGAALSILTGLVFFAVLAIWQWRHHPYMLIGLLIFLGMLVPNLGIVQVGAQARADRFTYLAQVGFFIALVWTCDALLPPARRLRIALACLPLAALGVVSISQVTKWQDSKSLFQHAVVVSEGRSQAMAKEYLGYAYSREGRKAAAALLFEQALAVLPRNSRLWNELGIIHLERGAFPLALRDFTNAVKLDARDPLALCNLAMTHVAMGEAATAEAKFRELLILSPEMPNAHLQYGLLLAKLGRKDEARQRIEEAHRLAPANGMIASALERVK